jgi:P27 family predicted phage terminase small subunit
LPGFQEMEDSSMKRGPKSRPPGILSARRVTIPKPPAWLSAEAAEVFTTTARALAADGLLRPAADGALLAVYAKTAAEIARIERILETEGQYRKGRRGAIVPHPAMRRQTRLVSQLAAFAAALGIGPVARRRAGVKPAAAPASSERDPTAAFVRLPE